MKDKPPIVNLTLRLPEPIALKLKHKAVDSRRTMNSEMIFLIEKGMEFAYGEKTHG